MFNHSVISSGQLSLDGIQVRLIFILSIFSKSFSANLGVSLRQTNQMILIKYNFLSALSDKD